MRYQGIMGVEWGPWEGKGVSGGEGEWGEGMWGRGGGGKERSGGSGGI